MSAAEIAARALAAADGDEAGDTARTWISVCIFSDAGAVRTRLFAGISLLNYYLNVMAGPVRAWRVSVAPGY